MAVERPGSNAMFDLTGKVILVAGGAGYLGTAVCEALARQGGAVVIADQHADRADQVAEAIRAGGGRSLGLSIELGDEGSIREAVAAAATWLGRLDILVNMTYGASGKGLEDLTAEDFDRANRINLTGGFLLAREAARAMTAGGSIILFASMYAQVSPDPRVYEEPMHPNPLEYGVGKAGVIQMARYLAVAWAPRGIRVNAIAPGPFPNPDVRRQATSFVERLAGRVPMGRVGINHEIAGPVVMLASDEAAYITGETIGVNGGWTAW